MHIHICTRGHINSCAYCTHAGTYLCIRMPVCYVYTCVYTATDTGHVHVFMHTYRYVCTYNLMCKEARPFLLGRVLTERQEAAFSLAPPFTCRVALRRTLAVSGPRPSVSPSSPYNCFSPGSWRDPLKTSVPWSNPPTVSRVCQSRSCGSLDDRPYKALEKPCPVDGMF